MKRDATRSAVYAVEEAVFGETLFAEPLGASGVLDLARVLNENAWWQANGVPFAVVPTRREARHSSASMRPPRDGPAQIRLSVFQEDAVTLAHETAHLLALGHQCDTAHGPLFLAAEIDVARVLCGTVAADRLARAFDDARLERAARRWMPPDQLTERGLFGRWRIAHLTGDRRPAR